MQIYGLGSSTISHMCCRNACLRETRSALKVSVPDCLSSTSVARDYMYAGSLCTKKSVNMDRQFPNSSVLQLVMPGTCYSPCERCRQGPCAIFGHYEMIFSGEFGVTEHSRCTLLASGSSSVLQRPSGVHCYRRPSSL